MMFSNDSIQAALQEVWGGVLIASEQVGGQNGRVGSLYSETETGGERRGHKMHCRDDGSMYLLK